MGFGSLIFNPLFQYLVNPDGELPDEETHLYSVEIANRLPNALRILSLTYIVVGIIGVLMMI